MHPPLKILVVIPARLNSSRLPNKPLIKIQGKTLIRHVYDNVAIAKKQLPNLLHHVVIATDSAKIYNHAKSFNANVLLTNPNHKNGTERTFEVAQKKKDFHIIVNAQGDEPTINASVFQSLLSPLIKMKFDPNLFAATTLKKLISSEEALKPNTVKVVCNQLNKALYFSRNPIPYQKNPNPIYYKHIGVYAYSKKFLAWYVNQLPTPLEQSENLEQLRILEKNKSLHVSEIFKDLIDINLQEDVDRFEQFLQNNPQ